MKGNSHSSGPGIILLFLLFMVPGVHAQDYQDIVSFFNNQFIPVEEIAEKGGIVTVKYNMENSMGPKEFGEDILYIFGKITKDFPDSGTIRIDCLADEDIIFEYEVSTKDVLEYVNGKIGDEEIKSRIKVKDFASTGALYFESRSRPAGSSVQIPLTLKGIKQKIGNMDMTLSYDPSVLEATEVIKGGLTADSIFDYNIQDNGKIKIGLAHNEGLGGDGSVAYVKFKVIGATGSSSPLEIAALDANSAQDYGILDIPANDGVFRVTSMEESKGDSDGDGEYTALDALYALQMAVDKIPLDLNLDIDGDGKVTSIDARRILKLAAGTDG